MRASLADYGIVYEHRGMNMGGLAGNVNEQESYDELAARAAEGEVIAVCCSEGDPKNCHRRYQITPALQKRGVSVIDLFFNKPAKPVTTQATLFG